MNPAQDVVTVLVGQVRVASPPTVLRALLGSCVAVCLFDDQAGVAGLNHFSLPERIPVAAARSSARQGSSAMAMLLQAALSAGAEPKRLRARIFGGAAVVETLGDAVRVGARNVATARRFLEIAGVTIVGEDVGGRQGRLIEVRTPTGECRVRFLPGRSSLFTDAEVIAHRSAR